MSTNDPDGPPREAPLAELERQLIIEYVTEAGYEYHALLARDDDEARRILAAAALCASQRLSEIESRSQYVHKLHFES